MVSGQNTASRNTRGRKIIGHKTTESNYQTVKLSDGQNTRGLGNQVMYNVKYDYNHTSRGTLLGFLILWYFDRLII